MVLWDEWSDQSSFFAVLRPPRNLWSLQSRQSQQVSQQDSTLSFSPLDLVRSSQTRRLRAPVGNEWTSLCCLLLWYLLWREYLLSLTLRYGLTRLAHRDAERRATSIGALSFVRHYVKTVALSGTLTNYRVPLSTAITHLIWFSASTVTSDKLKDSWPDLHPKAIECVRFQRSLFPLLFCPVSELIWYCLHACRRWIHRCRAKWWKKESVRFALFQLWTHHWRFGVLQLDTWSPI